MKSIRTSLEADGVLKEVAYLATEIATEISKLYLQKVPKWIARGTRDCANVQNTSHFMKRDTSGESWINVDVKFDFKLSEACDANWFAENMYTFAYSGYLDINGVYIKPNKILQIAALCKENPSEAIATIKSKAALTWDDI